MRIFSLVLLLLFVGFYPVEEVWGPGRYPDSPVWTFEGHTYIANQTTYDMSNNWPVVIDRGTEFDREGAWLMSAYRDNALVRGWYHAERDGHKTIAYAESSDGGATFQKPGYPYNQIITNPPIPNTDFDDEGDFWITINGDYFYLYFLASRDSRIHLARSLISDGGLPGTWWKWFEGGFTEPGLGGQSDPIAERWVLQWTYVSWNSYLGKWIGLHRRPDGWGLSTSEDGLSWERVDCTILAAAFQYPTSRPYADYFSFIGLDMGSRETGQVFWMYYMLIPPNGVEYQRYLVRQKMDLGQGCGPAVWFHYLPVFMMD